jgi:uncharacterized C2H2 Zn-finger protein
MFDKKIFSNQRDRSLLERCPLCKKGNIYELNLMQSVLSCDRCERIFNFNFEKQTIESVDSRTPIFWRWNGNCWQIIKPYNRSDSVYSGLFC